MPAIAIDDREDCGPLHKAPLRWSDGTAVLRRTWLLCREEASARPSIRAFVDHLLEAMPRCERQAAEHRPRRRRRRPVSRAGLPAPERSSR